MRRCSPWTAPHHRAGPPGQRDRSDPQQFRSWTPLATASDTRLWAALAGGGFVSSGTRVTCCSCKTAAGTSWRASPRPPELRGFRHVRHRRRRSGRQHPGVGPARAHPQRGRADQRARAGMTALRQEVRRRCGGSAQLVSLREPPPLPGDACLVRSKPGNYIQLFQESAAQYCPGCPGRCSPPSARSRAGTGRTPARPARARRARCSPAVYLGRVGDHRVRRAGPAERHGPLRRGPVRRPLLCAAGGATAAGCPAPSSPTTTRTGTWPRCSRSPRQYAAGLRLTAAWGAGPDRPGWS